MRISFQFILHAFAVLVFSAFMFQKFGGSIFGLVPNFALMVVAICLSLFYSKKMPLVVNFESFCVFLFTVILCISLFWSIAPQYGLSKVISMLLTILLAYSLFIPFKMKLNFLLICLFTSFALYAVQLYLDYGSFAQLFLQIGTRFRLGWNDAGNAFNPISIARYMAYSILVIFIVYPVWRPLISNQIWLNTFRTFLLILFVCSSVYLFFSGTKTPILALVICFLILFFKSNLSKFLKFSLLSIGIFGATFLLVAGVKVVPGLTDSQAAYIESRFLDVEAAVGDRSYQGSRATNNIALKAFLIGNGTGSFGYSNLKMDIRDYPHNIFAEVLYENGIFAVILLIVIYAMIVLNCIMSKDLLSSFCSFSALFFGVNAFFSGDLITNNLVFFFALVSSLVKRGQLKECT